MHTLDTTNWNSFPFEVDGIEFLSKISPESPMLKRILSLPAGVFEAINAEAISELIGDNFTREYVATKLDELNEGASHAVLELA